MGKRILVTGASRGIGKATAYELAKRGYNLFLVCRKNVNELELVAKDIKEQFGVDVRYIKCDVGCPEDVLEMTKTVNELGDLFGIVNNAAISYVGLLTDMSFDQWQDLMNVNLNSVFYICHELVPEMVRNKCGKIVNVSSVWGLTGASTEVAYSAAKGGINSFTKALAKELAPSNIQVNAVAFGVIDTDMNSCFTKEDMEALREEIPADRIGTPAEAGCMIADVLEAPSYMTGQIITMDGGFI